MVLVPLEYYTDVFYHISFILVLYTLFFTTLNTGQELVTVSSTKLFAAFLCISLILYMGLRPLSGYYFSDMRSYAMIFELMKVQDYSFNIREEWFFKAFVWVCSRLVSTESFFLICAGIYITPLYVASRRWFGHFYYLGFIICLGAFSFWAYGTNGIRNGMATSLVILALSFYDRKWLMGIIFGIVIGIHSSMMLPIIAFLTGYFYRNTKVVLLGWLLCIPLSLAIGDNIEHVFSNLNFVDDRLTGYLTNESLNDLFSSSSFRWDFLLYSAIPVYMGYHYIFQRGFLDRFYIQFFNTYLISNGFWILVIRASFSNRFAYLSWFMIPIILIYPLLKKTIWTRQYAKIGLVIFFHFLFSYIMFLRA